MPDLSQPMYKEDLEGGTVAAELFLRDGVIAIERPYAVLLERVFRAAERCILQSSTRQPIGHDAMTELRASVNAMRKVRGYKPIVVRYASVARDPGKQCTSPPSPVAPTNEQFYYDVLKRIARGYQSPEQLRGRAAQQYGLTPNEVIEMAYENIQADAEAAIQGKRRPTDAKARRVPSRARPIPTRPAQP